MHFLLYKPSDIRYNNSSFLRRDGPAKGETEQ